MPQIEVRHRLRIAREYAGLEQSELAEQIGVSRNTVGNAEKGRGEPRRIMINAWALACGVPASWILNGDDPGRPGDGPEGGPSPDPGGAPSRARTYDLRIISPPESSFTSVEQDEAA